MIMTGTTSKICRKVAPIRKKTRYVSNGGIRSDQGGNAYNKLHSKNLSGGRTRSVCHLFSNAHAGDLFQNSRNPNEFRFCYCGFRELRI